MGNFKFYTRFYHVVCGNTENVVYSILNNSSWIDLKDRIFFRMINTKLNSFYFIKTRLQFTNYLSNFSKNIKHSHAFSETNEVCNCGKNKGHFLVYALKKWQNKMLPVKTVYIIQRNCEEMCKLYLTVPLQTVNSRWPASLFKMSLFHRYFSNILLVKTN